MSVLFTDILLSLASPSKRAEFTRNPREFLAGRGLTEAEIAALISGDVGAIYVRAHSTSASGHQQFPRLGSNGEPESDVDTDVETETETDADVQIDMVVGIQRGQLYVDDTGRLYRLADL